MTSESNFINFMQLTDLRNIRNKINNDVFMKLLELQDELNIRRQRLQHGISIENTTLNEEFHNDLIQSRDAHFKNKEKCLFELLSARDHKRKAIVKEKLELRDRLNCEELRIKEHRNACRNTALANRELIQAKLQQTQYQCEFEDRVNKMVNYLNKQKDLEEEEKLKASKLHQKMLQQFLLNQIDEKEQKRKFGPNFC